jgi:hypothetical protein
MILTNIIPECLINISFALKGIVSIIMFFREDIYQVVRQIDGMENIVTKNEAEKIDLLQKLAEDYMDMEKLRRCTDGSENGKPTSMGSQNCHDGSVPYRNDYLNFLKYPNPNKRDKSHERG